MAFLIPDLKMGDGVTDDVLLQIVRFLPAARDLLPRPEHTFGGAYNQTDSAWAIRLNVWANVCRRLDLGLNG